MSRAGAFRRGIPGRAPEVITVFPLLAAATGGPVHEDHSVRSRPSRKKGEPSPAGEPSPSRGAFPLLLVSPLAHPFVHDAASAAHDLRGTS